MQSADSQLPAGREPSFTNMTEIQARTIPALLTGRDIMAQVRAELSELARVYRPGDATKDEVRKISSVNC